MGGLELIGADNLANQYITLRVRSIDKARLKNALGGSTGTMVASALSLVDTAPKAAIQMATPIVASKLRDQYGIDVEITVSGVPPSKGGQAISEFFPGVVLGLALGGGSLALWKLIAPRVARLLG